MLLNAKQNEYGQKMMWAEAVHNCERVRNSMANMISTTIPLENAYGEKSKIIGLFLEFVRIGYVTKRDKFEKKTTEKTSKAIMVGYADKHMRGTYKLYNTDTKRVPMTRGVK